MCLCRSRMCGVKVVSSGPDGCCLAAAESCHHTEYGLETRGAAWLHTSPGRSNIATHSSVIPTKYPETQAAATPSSTVPLRGHQPAASWSAGMAVTSGLLDSGTLHLVIYFLYDSKSVFIKEALRCYPALSATGGHSWTPSEPGPDADSPESAGVWIRLPGLQNCGK
ncbi:neurocalcin-delta isoform X4 [Cavia porcellus]|uniref:neurocalcin-delta isoform X4 n=1 Tax=Cavia porcellus TaxID=10141 RepID=UPI002FE3C7A4